MATETLYPDALLAQAGLTGAVSTIASAEDGTWMTSTGSGATLTVSFPTPTGSPTTGANLQTFRIWVRKDASGGGDPTIDSLDLYENGTLVTTLLSGASVTSATGQAVTVTWDASALGTADGSAVELDIVSSKGGGGPNERNVEFDSVSWVVDYTAAGPVAVDANVGAATLTGFTPTVSDGTVGLYRRDFSGEATGVGVAVPADFTFFANGATEDIDIIEDANAVGGKFLRFNVGSSGVHYITWDTPGSLPDSEYLMQVRTSSFASTSVQGAHTFLRASPTSTAYVANRFEDLAAGSTAFYGEATDDYTGLGSHTRTTDTGVWWVRAQVVGDAYKMRYWKPTDPNDPGADEPVAWDIEVDLSAYSVPATPTTGRVAFGARQSAGLDLDLGYIGVSDDPSAASAPYPESGVTVEANTGAATATGFTPTILAPRVVTANVGTASTTGFTPSVVVDNIIQANVGTATATGFTTTILTPRTIQANTGTITVSGFTPTILTPRVVSANVGTATLTTFTATVLTPRVVTPSVGSATLTGFTPTVLTPRVVTPSVGTTTVTGFVATVTLSAGKVVQANAGAATLTGFTATIQTPRVVQASVGAASVAGLTPIVVASAHITISASVGQATTSGFTPVIAVSDNQFVTANTGTATATGFTPIIGLTDHKAILANAGSATAAGFTTVVSVSDHKVVTANTGVGTFNGYTPLVQAGGNQTVSPNVGLVKLSGPTPTVMLFGPSGVRDIVGLDHALVEGDIIGILRTGDGQIIYIRL